MGDAASVDILGVFFGVEVEVGLAAEVPGAEQRGEPGVFEDCLAHAIGVLRNRGKGDVVLLALILLDL